MTTYLCLNSPRALRRAAAHDSGDFMQNVLRNLGRRSAAPQDTANSDSATIDTGCVLPRGMERSAFLKIKLSPVDMDAAAADEGENISVAAAYVGGYPAGKITRGG